MKVSIPRNGIYGMTDDELQAAILDAEDREVLLRHYLAELRLHRMMRKHVEQQHIRENIKKLQQELAELEAAE